MAGLYVDYRMSGADCQKVANLQPGDSEQVVALVQYRGVSEIPVVVTATDLLPPDPALPRFYSYRVTSTADAAGLRLGQMYKATLLWDGNLRNPGSGTLRA